ncbi:bacteriophage replication gene A protein (GPA), partial [Acinetobacter baumannii ABNIH18]
RWQGRLDSNQRMAGSKPAALPLGDAPNTIIITGGKWQGRLDSNQRMAGSKPAALPLGDAPNLQL